MSSLFGGGTKTTTKNSNDSGKIQTVMPSWLQPQLQSVADQASSLATKPYQPYTGEQVAGLNQDQLQAMQFTRGLPGATNGYYNTAQNLFGQVANYGLNGPSQGQLNQYINPYINNVLNQQQTRDLNAYSQQANQLRQQQAALGAFGGSRSSLAQSQLLNNFNQNEQYNQGNAYANAYNQAQAGVTSGMQMAGNAGLQIAGQGQNQQQSNLQAINALSQSGNQQQAQNQAVDTSGYQNYLNAQQFPYQAMQSMSPILQNLGGLYKGTAQSGQSSSTEQQSTSSSPLSSIVGGLAMGAGILGTGGLIGLGGLASSGLNAIGAGGLSSGLGSFLGSSGPIGFGLNMGNASNAFGTYMNGAGSNILGSQFADGGHVRYTHMDQADQGNNYADGGVLGLSAARQSQLEQLIASQTETPFSRTWDNGPGYFDGGVVKGFAGGGLVGSSSMLPKSNLGDRINWSLTKHSMFAQPIGAHVIGGHMGGLRAFHQPHVAHFADGGSTLDDILAAQKGLLGGIFPDPLGQDASSALDNSHLGTLGYNAAKYVDTHPIDTASDALMFGDPAIGILKGAAKFAGPVADAGMGLGRFALNSLKGPLGRIGLGLSLKYGEHASQPESQNMNPQPIVTANPATQAMQHINSITGKEMFGPDDLRSADQSDTSGVQELTGNSKLSSANDDDGLAAVNKQIQANLQPKESSVNLPLLAFGSALLSSDKPFFRALGEAGSAYGTAKQQQHVQTLTQNQALQKYALELLKNRHDQQALGIQQQNANTMQGKMNNALPLMQAKTALDQAKVKQLMTTGQLSKSQWGQLVEKARANGSPDPIAAAAADLNAYPNASNNSQSGMDPRMLMLTNAMGGSQASSMNPDNLNPAQ